MAVVFHVLSCHVAQPRELWVQTDFPLPSLMCHVDAHSEAQPPQFLPGYLLAAHSYEQQPGQQAPVQKRGKDHVLGICWAELGFCACWAAKRAVFGQTRVRRSIHGMNCHIAARINASF